MVMITFQEVPDTTYKDLTLHKKTEYFCHIWTETAQFTFLSIARVEKLIHDLAGDELFSNSFPQTGRRKTLICRYFHGKLFRQGTIFTSTDKLQTSTAIKCHVLTTW